MNKTALVICTVIALSVTYNLHKLLSLVYKFVEEEQEKSKDIFDQWDKANSNRGILSKGVPSEIWSHNLRSSELLNLKKSISGAKSLMVFLCFTLPLISLIYLIAK